MAAVTTTKTALVKLFRALGVDTAGEWPADKLKIRAEDGLAKYLEPGQTLPPEEKKLYDEIEDRDADDKVTVTDDAAREPKKPAAKKKNPQSQDANPKAWTTPPKKGAPAPAATSGAASSGSKESPPSTKSETEPTTRRPKKEPVRAKRAGGWKPGDPPLPFDETRGPGVIRTLVYCLKAASPDNPLTKEAAVAKLKAAFPDRDTAKLTTTVNNQIPSRLRIVRGIHVWSNAAGYWVAGEGKTPQKDKIRPTPQPKESQVKNAAKAGSKPAATKTQPGAKPTGKPAAKPVASPVKKGPAGKGGKAVDAQRTVAGKAMAKASAGKKK